MQATTNPARKSTGLGWRLFWGLVASGLVGTLLTVSGLDLEPPVLIGISLAAGVIVAIVGPALLEMLALL
jgi:hypothetical protein